MTDEILYKIEIVNGEQRQLIDSGLIYNDIVLYQIKASALSRCQFWANSYESICEFWIDGKIYARCAPNLNVPIAA